MSILGKLMFWKKKDEFADIGLGDKSTAPQGIDLGMGPDFGAGSNLGYGTGGQNFGMPQPSQQQSFQPYPQPTMPQFQQTTYQPYQQTDMTSKNLEIISSKLDALRAAMESINQRLANLEAIARGEEDNRRRRW